MLVWMILDKAVVKHIPNMDIMIEKRVDRLIVPSGYGSWLSCGENGLGVGADHPQVLSVSTY